MRVALLTMPTGTSSPQSYGALAKTSRRSEHTTSPQIRFCREP